MLSKTSGSAPAGLPQDGSNAQFGILQRAERRIVRFAFVALFVLTALFGIAALGSYGLAFWLPFGAVCLGILAVARAEPDSQTRRIAEGLVGVLCWLMCLSGLGILGCAGWLTWIGLHANENGVMAVLAGVMIGLFGAFLLIVGWGMVEAQNATRSLDQDRALDADDV